MAHEQAAHPGGFFLGAPIRVLDSITEALGGPPGQVVVSGSHGGVSAGRFALQALYGHGEPSLIEGIRPINPLDVLDLILLHRKSGAFILDTWTV